MAEDGKIVYKIVIDDNGVITEAARVGKDAGDAFGRGAGAMEEVWKGASRRIGEAFVEMARDAVRQAWQLLTGSLETGMEFDAALSQVQAVSQANADQMQELRDLALKMGRETKYSAVESAEALTYMGMAGWTATQMVEGLPAILQLAAASGEDLGTTSDIVTDALTAFKLEAKDAQHFANVLAMAAASSNTNVGMMGESFKYAASLAGTMGYTIDDIAIAFGLMANSGIKASMAGTAMRGILTQMAEPSDKTALAMDQLGIALSDSEGKAYTFMEIMQNMRTAFRQWTNEDDLKKYAREVENLNKQFDEGAVSEEDYEFRMTTLQRMYIRAPEEAMAQLAAALGGRRALAGLLAIVNATDEDFNDLAESIYGASGEFALMADGSVLPLNKALASGMEIVKQYTGAAEMMSDIMMNNLKGDVTILKSAWEGFKIELSDKLTPIIREIMPDLIALVNRLIDKLHNADWSKMGDTILRIAEKLVTVLEWIIDNADTVITLIETLAVGFAGKKLTGWLGGTGLADSAKDAGLGFLFGAGKKAATGAATGAAAGGATGGALATGAAASLPALLLGAFGFGIYDKVNANRSGRAAAAESEGKSVEELRQRYAELTEQIDELGKKYDEAYEADMWDTTGTDYGSYGMGLELDKLRAERDEIEKMIGEAEGTVTETLSGLADDAHTYGSDTAAEYAAGLEEGSALYIVPALAGLAGMVAAYLHHSTPDRGPLAGDDEWMPDMIQGWARQIEEYAPELGAALSGALPTRSDFERSLSVQIAGTGGAGRRVIEVPVNLNGREIARATAWDMGEQLAWEEL